MKNNNIAAVVVGGWMNEKGEQQFITLLGAFEDTTEAYGKAYLYLDELSGNYKEEDGMQITPLYELEGETGYAMYLQGKDGKALDYAYILFNNNYEKQEEKDARNT